MCGLLEATSGSMRLAGEQGNLRSESIRQQIGYMSQKFSLYNDMTIRENLSFFAGVYGVPESERDEKIRWVLSVSYTHLDVYKRQVGNVSKIVEQLKQERERAQKEVQTFDAAITALGSNGSNAQPLQPKPQPVPVAAQPAQTKPQPAPAAGQPPQPNPQPTPAPANPAQPNTQSAPAAAQPSQAKPKPAPADAKPPRSMARRIIIPVVVILILAAVGFGVWRCV